ncbi:hypothetical protein RhiTH_009500 [Rhizoctonia solani]
MTKAKKIKVMHKTPLWAKAITPDLFKGLNIHSDGSELITRNRPAPNGSSHELKQKLDRETLQKAEHDMERSLLKEISRAIDNQKFENAREKGIPLNKLEPFGTLTSHPVRLTVNKGPVVVTDRSGIPILWYFPRFIGAGLQANLLQRTSELAHVYQPPKDELTGNRRGGLKNEAETKIHGQHTGRITQSQANKQQATLTNLEYQDQDVQAEVANGSICTQEIEVPKIDGSLASVSKYQEDDGEVRIISQGSINLDQQTYNENRTSAFTQFEAELQSCPPFAYYLSPGWCQTGMQNVRPIQMSKHFREALKDGPKEMVNLLEAKRLLDKKLEKLTNIIHPSLSESMHKLRNHMSAVEGPTQVSIQNGWTSIFPCYGIAVNRVTGIHRDQRGIRGGLDIIGVLGSFTEGGNLDLPDLNLRLEWKPGCLGAFNGYDFRHRVLAWSGGSRVTLISFCQKATWDCLGLETAVSRPSIVMCQAQLAKLKDQRRKAIETELTRSKKGCKSSRGGDIRNIV